MLLREIKKIFHTELDARYSKEEVDSFFYLLLEHYLQMPRFVLALNPDLVIAKEQEGHFFQALSELVKDRPIQYVIGSCNFMDLSIMVNEKVLIPRPETEELVQWILSDFGNFPKGDKEQLKILDIGTGSGCIAVALGKYLPHSTVFGLDISEEILEVAKANAEANEVNLQCIRGDIMNLENLAEPFDIIVANPPYVRESEKKEMQENVTAYEPNRALYVPDTHPLIYYEQIIDFAASNLNKAGALFLEINQYLGKEARELLEVKQFQNIILRQDMFGNDRMLKGLRNWE